MESRVQERTREIINEVCARLPWHYRSGFLGRLGVLSSNVGTACAYSYLLGIRGPSVKIHNAAKRSYSAGGVVRL